MLQVMRILASFTVYYQQMCVPVYWKVDRFNLNDYWFIYCCYKETNRTDDNSKQVFKFWVVEKKEEWKWKQKFLEREEFKFS